MATLGGHLDFREENVMPGVSDNVCLAFEFENDVQANRAVSKLQAQGEYVEGPYEYGGSKSPEL
jgi:hypothetical protein